MARKIVTGALLEQIYDWHGARLELGNTKVFAAKIGLHPQTVTHVIMELRKHGPKKKGDRDENNGRSALPRGDG